MFDDSLTRKESSLGSLFDSVDDNSVKTEPLTDEENSVSSESIDSEVIKRTDSFTSSSTSDDGDERAKLAKCMSILKTVNDFVFDEREMLEEQKSQARKNDEDKYQALKNSVNKIITKYDERISKYGTNLDKYLNFIENISAFDNPITSKRIIELSGKIQPEEKTYYSVRKAMKIRRAVMGFSAGFVLKSNDINKYNKLSKSDKMKIKLVKELVELEKNQEILPQDKQNRYAEINRSFISLDSKDKRIEKKETLRMLAKQMHKKKLFSLDTVSQFKDKALHPYSKIIDREDLSAAEKTAKLGEKIVEKVAQGGKAATRKLGKTVLATGQSMIKHSVKQPAATVYRGSMAMLNAVEYLTLEAKILSEKDLDVKETLRAEAEITFQNMGYEGEKFIRAAAATVGIALLDTAMVATAGGGIAAPAALGITASEKFIQGSLVASQVADTIQTTRDGVEKINEGIKSFQKQKGKLTRQETRTRDRRDALKPSNLPKQKEGTLKRFLKNKESYSSSVVPHNKPTGGIQSH